MNTIFTSLFLLAFFIIGASCGTQLDPSVSSAPAVTLKSKKKQSNSDPTDTTPVVVVPLALPGSLGDASYKLFTRAAAGAQSEKIQALNELMKSVTAIFEAHTVARGSSKANRDSALNALVIPPLINITAAQFKEAMQQDRELPDELIIPGVIDRISSGLPKQLYDGIVGNNHVTNVQNNRIISLVKTLIWDVVPTRRSKTHRDSVIDSIAADGVTVEVEGTPEVVPVGSRWAEDIKAAFDLGEVMGPNLIPKPEALKQSFYLWITRGGISANASNAQVNDLLAALVEAIPMSLEQRIAKISEKADTMGLDAIRTGALIREFNMVNPVFRAHFAGAKAEVGVINQEIPGGFVVSLGPLSGAVFLPKEQTRGLALEKGDQVYFTSLSSKPNRSVPGLASFLGERMVKSIDAPIINFTNHS